MRIGTPELEVADGCLTWSVTVDGLAGTPERLWFRLPEQHAGLVTERADPAVIGLLLPAMHAAEAVEVAGPVTDELSHNLTHGYQEIFEAVVVGLRRVGLETPNTVPADEPPRGVATGFSGGVDSFTVLAEHYFRPVPDAMRLSHLTMFNVGSLTRGERGRELFHRLHDLLAPAADRFGLPLVPVDSNLDEFYAFGNYQQSYGPRNMSAASLLQGGIGRYYFAGSVPYPFVGVHRSNGTGRSDPVSIPLLTTRQFRAVSHGNQYTRVEKTLIVADTPASYSCLNVCVDPLPDARNCSRCHKCVRTQLTLEISGRLDDYAEVFDRDAYRRARAAHLDRVVLAADDEFEAEIRTLARNMAFRLPFKPAAAARTAARGWSHAARTGARRIRNRIRNRRRNRR